MTEQVARCRPLLGTFVEIISDDGAAIDAAFAAIEMVHLLMSAHDQASELSRINRMAHEQSVALHPWTEQVIRRALFWAEASDGAFDPAIGSVMRASGEIPDVGPTPCSEATWRDVEVMCHTLRFRKPTTLDLGGIAKGFAVDRAVEALKESGSSYGLVNAGGDLRGFGTDSWPVTIVDPLTRRPCVEIPLSNAALATSAVRRDSAGQPDWRHLPLHAPPVVSATVMTDLAMDADALCKVVLSGSPLMHTCLALASARALRINASGSIENLTRFEEAA